MSKFDGAALNTDSPARMEIVSPHTGQPLIDADGKAAFVSLYGLDSERAQKHQRAVTNRRLAQRGVRTKLDAEQIEAEQVELLAALTEDWHLVDVKTAAPLAVGCTPADARDLYAHRGMRWLREQVEAFVADRANF